MPARIIPAAPGDDDREETPPADAPEPGPGGLTREEYVQAYFKRQGLPRAYWYASKRGKGEILDHAEHATGLHRKSLIRRLRRPSGGRPAASPKDPGRPRVYDDKTRVAVVMFSRLMGGPGERQLVASFRPWLSANERYSEVSLEPHVVDGMLKMSAATAGRIVRAAPKRRPGASGVPVRCRGEGRARLRVLVPEAGSEGGAGVAGVPQSSLPCLLESAPRSW